MAEETSEKSQIKFSQPPDHRGDHGFLPIYKRSLFLSSYYTLSFAAPVNNDTLSLELVVSLEQAALLYVYEIFIKYPYMESKHNSLDSVGHWLITGKKVE